MQNEKRSKYTSVVFIIIILISLFCLFARQTASVRVVKNFIYYILYPTIETAHLTFTATGDIAQNFKEIVSIHQDNLNYKRINHELADKLYNYNEMKSRYDNLINLLQIPKIKNIKTVFARVASRQSSEWYQWLILDKGLADGLSNELPVEMYKSDGQFYAVGRIVETYDHSAKVALTTNLLAVTPAQIKGKNISCLAEGTNSRYLKITYIPFDADVIVGDEVIVSHLSSVFDESTALGVIKSISKGASVDYKTAQAEVFFDFDSPLDTVIILVPQKENIN
jgi:rod shape-determining protein MreC